MHDTFLAITVLTLGAALLVGLFQRIHLSPILAYLVLGILAGPLQHLLFKDPEGAETLADFGVILLMFFIGLEFHLDEMRSMLKLCLSAGTLQVLLATGVGGLIAWMLGAHPLVAMILGVMLAISSTALVMKAFEDRGESDSQRARVALAVLLFQDLAAILVVAMLPLASAPPAAGKIQSSDSGGIFGKLALLLVVLPALFLACRHFLPRVFEKAAAARRPEAFSLLSLGACFSIALAAQWAGASLPLGAFLGGLVLCRTPFASQIMADLSPLRNLALGFFFVSVGMLVDLPFVSTHILELLAALLALVLLKTLTAAAALRILRVPSVVAAGVALAIAQVGEFSFVLGKQAEAAHLLPPEPYKFVMALAVLSMLLTPFLVNYSLHFGRWIANRIPNTPTEDLPKSNVAILRAVVVGYGPVGKTLTRILTDFHIHPVVIDMNIETVKKLAASGITAIYGDAGRREVLKAANIEQASYLLVTLPDLPGRIPVVATARVINPGIKIFTRARYLAERAMMEDAGATAVSYEEAEVAVSLAGFLLKEIGAKDVEVEREAERIRGELSLRGQ